MHAIVLAAGNGRRVGGAKARLVAFGTSLLEQHVRRAESAGAAVIAVVRPDDVAIVPAGVRAVVSREPDQAGSLARGVAALPVDADVVLVTPVDALPAREDTWRALASALRGDVLAVTPTHRGRGGHPAVLRRCVLAAYDAGGRPPLRDVLDALGARRVRLEVDDPRVVTDLDDAASVVAATGAPPRFG